MVKNKKIKGTPQEIKIFQTPNLFQDFGTLEILYFSQSIDSTK